jgi:hypothetical protein
MLTRLPDVPGQAGTATYGEDATSLVSRRSPGLEGTVRNGGQ